jgi:hypothetical protein
MRETLPPHFIDLVFDAALKSFWTRRALHNFLRRCHVSEQFLAIWNQEESKRDLLYRLFPVLEKTEKGKSVIKLMARHLADQTTFPDLERWEDSAEKKEAATTAVATLKKYLLKQQQEFQDEQESVESRKRVQTIRQETIKRQKDLTTLDARLNKLAKELGSQGSGYAFQEWFYDLMTFFEVICRRPYVSDGRQIDGSVTVEGTTYLVELKFTDKQAGAPDIDTFLKKVNDKADNTMGLMVSISGYSSVAIRGASGARTPLLLLDHNHLYLMLSGTFSFVDVVNRVRRHASQTAEAYLNASEFGG